MELRPYQLEALRASKQALDEGVYRQIIVAATGLGKCLSIDTYVWSDGLRTFAGAWGNCKIAGPHNTGNINAWYDDGVNPGFLIKTALGITLDGTLAHRVWVRTQEGYEGWKTLQDLKIGDYVGVGRGKADFGTQEIPLDKAYTLGLLVADGSISDTDTTTALSFTKHPVVVNALQKSLRELSNSAGGYTSKARVHTVSDNKAYIKVHAPKMREFMHSEYGLSLVSSLEREVPTAILLGTREVVRAFLRGYFDGDGYCSPMPEMSTGSRVLAEQIQQLLLGLGVLATLKTKMTASGNPAYIVTANDVDAFASEVGFTPYGLKKDLAFQAALERKHNTNIDVIPGVGRLIKSVAQRLESRKRRYDAWKHADAYYTGAKKPGYTTLRSMVEGFDDGGYDIKELRRIVDDNFAWTPVVAKEPSQVHRIDCEVDETHSFIGNGIVNHNTAILANLREHHGFKKKMLFLVHREELVKQAASSIDRWHPEYNIGIEMGATRCNAWDNVVVASVPTLGRSGSDRIKKFHPDDFDCVVVDEVHRGIADSYMRVYEYFGLLSPENKKLLLGVTATPNRSDGNPLAGVFDKIVFHKTIRESIEEGWLCDLRGVRVKTTVDLEGVHTRAGDFDQGELSQAVNTPTRNDLIVRNWSEIASTRKTIAFTVDIQHAKDLAQSFKKYGVAAEAVWGDDPDRAEKLQYHKSGGLQVLTSVSVLVEGYDDPSVSCIVMARPTKSQLLFTQMIGRGTRLPKGMYNLKEAIQAGETPSKTDCLVLDVADTTQRHSLVSVSSLFGLGQKTDLKGKSVIESVKLVEEARQENPQVDFSKLEDITKLKSFVEEVNLFEVKFPDEVVKFSKLQWYKIDDDHYFIKVNGKDRVDIARDFLDRWGAAGCVDGCHFREYHLDTLQDAFSYADNMISIYGKKYLTLLRREAKWHKDPATEFQIAFLKRLKVPIPENLTKGDAQKMIGAAVTGGFKYRRSAGIGGLAHR